MGFRVLKAHPHKAQVIVYTYTWGPQILTTYLRQWYLDSLGSFLGLGFLGFGFWFLGFWEFVGFWVLDYGFWVNFARQCVSE